MVLVTVSSTTLAATLAVCALRPDPATADPGARESLTLPLTFVENVGQWATPARFVAARGEAVIRVEERGFLVDTRPTEGGERLLLRFDFVGARDSVLPAGEDRLPGVRNYFLGDDPERWHSGVRGYARVVYPDLYEGIDLCLREAGGRLEYDLFLAPGADPSRVVVRCHGVESLAVDEDGALALGTELGTLRQTPPRTWSVLPSGEREPLECCFVRLDETSYGFRITGRDAELPAVIDPGLEWATFLGGSTDDWTNGMVREPGGELVAVGYTTSPDFPTANGVDSTLGGPVDGFVTVLDSSGSTLLWSTYVGGSDFDNVMDVVVGSAGDVFVTGFTKSTDFPSTPDGFSTTQNGGGWDGFVMQFHSNGRLTYSSYLGGSTGDWPTDIELREPRILTLAGTVGSSDFPTTLDALQPAKAGFRDFFVCRLDLDQPPAAQLLYSTYLGGTDHEGFAISTSNQVDVQAFELHLDAGDIVTVTGTTLSPNFWTTPDAYDATFNGARDTVLTRLDPSRPGLAGLLYSTFIGGSSGEGPMALAIDGAGVVTLGGFTYSSDFPVTPGAFDTTFLGPANHNDGFVLRLDPGLPAPDQLLYSTFLSGDGWDPLVDLALDARGRILAQGWTGADGLSSNSFPTTCGAYSQVFDGPQDGYLLYLDPAGGGRSDLLYSTFLGGSETDGMTDGLEIVPGGPTLRVVATGFSQSTDFPTTPGVIQPALGGAFDAFLLQLEINPHTYCDAAPNSAGPDGAIICGSESVSITDNTFTLSASGAIPGDFGLFFYSDAVDEMPYGDGTLCLGGSLYRLQPPLQSDASGASSRLLDFTQPPTDAGPGAITPGSTWYFQFWYRDPNAGGSGFNFSNGLKTTFHP